MRKTSNTPIFKVVVKNTCPVYPQNVKVIKNMESLRNCQSRATYGDMMTKCNMVSKMGY